MSANNQQGLIAWFVRNPVAANLLLLLVLILGVLQAGQLRREAFPGLESSSLTIQVQYDSGSAQQGEEGVAIKIEQQLQDVAGIKSIESESTDSQVTVTVEKLSDVDLDDLFNRVRDKVDAISTFPAEAKKPVMEKVQRSDHALWIQLSGSNERATLQQLAADLRSDLLADIDISGVELNGWLDPIIDIEVDEARLQAYGLSFADIEQAVQQGSSAGGRALINQADFYLQLGTQGQAYQAREFADLPLRYNADGVTIRLGDVAVVRDGYSDSDASLSRYNGDVSIALQIVSKGNTDISRAVDAAEAIVEQWRNSGRLPSNLELTTWYDRSEFINDRLALLADNALTGILLVFVLLALFLNTSVAFWVAMGLPFTFFGTLYFMGDDFLGLSLNEFTTFGFIMALGIVVDDAVVVGESIYTTRRQHGDSVGNTIIGTQRVAVPTLFGVLTTVAAFFALSLTSGPLGQLYAQFATVVAVCLLLSMVESKLILPSHLTHLNTRANASEHRLQRRWRRLQQALDDGLQWFIQHLYQPALRWALQHRYVSLLWALIIFTAIASLPITGAVRLSFFPALPGDTVSAYVTLHDDASHGMTHRALLQLEQAAYRAEQTLQSGADSGIGSLQLLTSGNRSGSVTIELNDQASYDLNQLKQAWQQQVGWPEGVKTLSIQSHSRLVSDLEIELRSSDEQQLQQATTALREHISALPAVSGVEDTMAAGQPSVMVHLNAKGKALGLTHEQLSLQLRQGFDGQVVQRFQRDTDEVEVTVRYPSDQREDMLDVFSAYVRLPSGQSIALDSVADLQMTHSRSTIQRIDGKRAFSVSADVDKSIQSSTELVMQLRQQLVVEFAQRFPAVELSFAGEAEHQDETQSSMLSLFFAALLIIYGLLAVPLKSYWQPLIIMMAIPFGILGAILGHWLNDIALGILSFNGIIALAGVVVNDSLLLVSRFNELRQHCHDWQEALVTACSSRLRAVLLTSLTTFAGLLPLLSETSFQAQFLIPAAVSLAYGIIFATLITLVLVPVLLWVQQDIALRWQRRWALKEPEDAQRTVG
ncbi:acriflavine resistance protein B [Bacterioplanes sanyensis]|uniref:Acriflavine resistance protein B n=1 Tax=Bacterioplanes sanyensis TaxID=1249553 RepID=A0A222FHH5_9GAMM|nr:efflux RND transporter permease subunit [Bacterioplanes sanyensis]ASP38210.1 acriflavine resistance protein B [Bacterioplanes sanyensis]